ncbi:MAG: alpha-glucosidase, partial [Turicibacter sp.]
KQAIFYEIYVPSFKDGNEDGVGDFKGIISKLDYLKDLGITGIWLTPIFPSPKVDNGYDISDYENIAPEYGTMADFSEFIEQAHARGIRVIMDLVLNHTSDQHEWFKSARTSEDSIYRDYYIWQKKIPNNWESFFAGSAWEYDALTESYYYHAFAKEQVCLNYSNPSVIDEMFKIVAFWLEKGVDGFRLDVINFLKSDLSALSKDNPVNEDGKQEHVFDKDQVATLGIIKQLRQFVDQWDDKYLLGEVGSEDLNELNVYVGDDLLHSVFNFNLGSVATLDVDKLFDEIQKMEDLKLYPTVFFSSHDMSRHMSRLCHHDKDLAKTLATLMLTVKGIPFIYQGDELGMHDLLAHTLADISDIQGKLTYEVAIKNGKTHEVALVLANENCRDKSRSPIQWDNSKYAGFSSVKPWLSVASEHDVINVMNELDKEDSILRTYQKLMAIRKECQAFNEDYTTLEKHNQTIMIERGRGAVRVLIVLCFDEAYELDIKHLKVESLLFSSKNRRDVEKKMILSKEALIFLLKEE